MEAKLNIFKKLNQTDNFKLTIYLKRVPSPDPFFCNVSKSLFEFAISKNAI
jgi:hypothetical protein